MLGRNQSITKSFQVEKKPLSQCHKQILDECSYAVLKYSTLIGLKSNDTWNSQSQSQLE